MLDTHRTTAAEDLHVARARRMLAAGAVVEATFYLRHRRDGARKHAEYIRSKPSVATTKQDEREIAALEAHALACEDALAEVPDHTRSIEACAPLLPDDVRSEWISVPNPHWPDLDSHGVYVSIDERNGGRWFLDVQVLPPDAERSQVCATRLYDDERDARLAAGVWLSVGRAIIAATK